MRRFRSSLRMSGPGREAPMHQDDSPARVETTRPGAVLSEWNVRKSYDCYTDLVAYLDDQHPTEARRDALLRAFEALLVTAGVNLDEFKRACYRTVRRY